MMMMDANVKQILVTDALTKPIHRIRTLFLHSIAIPILLLYPHTIIRSTRILKIKLQISISLTTKNVSKKYEFDVNFDWLIFVLVYISMKLTSFFIVTGL